MRSNSVEEYYITGDAPTREKFQKWADTLEKLIGNPLYHWSHLELKRYFGYEGHLSGETAAEVWQLCTARFKTEQMTSLANLGMLSNFVGMLTDSRSFLSYTRHEYFRRILCDLNSWADLLPNPF